MKYVKFIKTAVVSNFEDNINEALKENEHAKLVDIKHSSGNDGNSLVYTAVIIFEDNR